MGGVDIENCVGLTPLCRNCRSSKFVKCSNNSRTTGSLHFLTDNTALIGQKIERCPLPHITCFAKNSLFGP